MDFQNFTILTAIILHMIVATYTQLKINKSNLLNPIQKRINTVLIWIIPFLWPFIVRSFIKERKTDVMTKTNRKSKTGKNSDNWQNLTGYGGD